MTEDIVVFESINDWRHYSFVNVNDWRHCSLLKHKAKDAESYEKTKDVKSYESCNWILAIGI